MIVEQHQSIKIIVCKTIIILYLIPLIANVTQVEDV